MTGLDIDIEQFRKLKRLDRDEVIYKNLVHIRKTVGDTKFHRKIHYVWLLVLTAVLGIKRYLGV